MAEVIARPRGTALSGGLRPFLPGHLAVFQALARHAAMTGMSLPYVLVREMVARAAGYVGAHQMLKAITRGEDTTILDPTVLTVAMSAWSIPLTADQAVACIRAGAPEIQPKAGVAD